MRWKRVLYVTLFLSALLILAVYVVLETYDYNRLKPVIAGAVKNATGRELVIQGDIGIDWGRHPGIRIEGIRFQNAPWGSRADAVTVGSLEIEVALLPLIIGRIEIPRLLIDFPDILLETDPTGETNLTLSSEKAEGKPSAALPRQVVIDKFIIQNGLFVYRDRAKDTEFTLALDRLETEFDFEANRVDLSSRGVYQEIPFQIKGYLDRPLPAIIAGKPLPADFWMQFGNTEIAIAGHLEDPSRLKGLDIKLRASGPSLPAALAPAGLEGFPELGDFRLTAHLTGSSEAVAVDELAFHVGTAGTAEADINGRVDNLLTGEGTDLVISIQGQNLGKLEEVLDTPLPPYNLFSVNARLRQTELKLFHLSELDLKVDKSDVRADLTLDLRQARPLLSGQVHTRRMDLVPLFAANDQQGHSAVTARMPAESPKAAPVATAVDDLLKTVDADLVLKTGDIVFPWMKLTEMETRARLQNGIASFTVQGPALPDIEELAGVSRLQELGPFRLSGNLAMENGALALHSVDLVAGTPEQAQVSVTGEITEISAARGFNLDYTISGNEAAVLGKYLIQPWPCRGNFILSGRMVQPQGYNFQFPGISGRLGDIAFGGKVGLALDDEVDRIHIEVAASKFNLRPFAFKSVNIPAGWKNISDLGPLAAEIKIVVPDGPVGFEAVDIRTGKSDLLAANLSGRVVDIENQRGIDLHLTVRGDELKNFEKILGRSIPVHGPIAFDVAFSDPSPGKYRFSPIITAVGSETLTADLVFDTTRRRPFLSASIRAEAFDLNAILRRTADYSALKTHFSETILAERLILPRWPLPPLPILDKDADISIDIKQLIAPKVAIDDLTCQFELDNGRIAVKAGGRPHTAPDVLTGISGRLDFGQVDLAVQGTADKERLGIDTFRLNAGDPDSLELKLAGKARDIVRQEGLDIDFMIQSKHASTLNNFITLHKTLEGSFSLSGHLIDPRLKSYRLEDLRLSIGDSDLSGWVNIDLTSQRPRFDAVFSSRQLDLRPFLGYADLEGVQAPESENSKNKTPIFIPKSPSPKLFSTEPLPLDWLEQLNMQVAFQCRELFSKWVVFEDLDVDLLLENGNLALQPLRFKTGEGSVSGHLKLQKRNGGKTAAVFLEVDDYDIGEDLVRLGTDRELKGSVDAQIDVDGPAESLAAFMGRLNGRIVLSLEEGRVNEQYIGLLYSDLRSTLLRLINPFGTKDKYIDINCFINTFQVQNGNATYASVLDTDQTTLYGAGTVDLTTERLNVTLKSDPKKGFNVEGLRISFSLSDLAKPFKLGGTLARPSLAVDPTGTVFAFGKILGGLALGPAGIALILTEVSMDVDNPCAKALLESQNDLKKK